MTKALLTLLAAGALAAGNLKADGDFFERFNRELQERQEQDRIEAIERKVEQIQRYHEDMDFHSKTDGDGGYSWRKSHDLDDY
jgi:hypothetical protein